MARQDRLYDGVKGYTHLKETLYDIAPRTSLDVCVENGCVHSRDCDAEASLPCTTSLLFACSGFTPGQISSSRVARSSQVLRQTRVIAHPESSPAARSVWPRPAAALSSHQTSPHSSAPPPWTEAGRVRRTLSAQPTPSKARSRSTSSPPLSDRRLGIRSRR